MRKGRSRRTLGGANYPFGAGIGKQNPSKKEKASMLKGIVLGIILGFVLMFLGAYFYFSTGHAPVATCLLYTSPSPRD